VWKKKTINFFEERGKLNGMERMESKETNMGLIKGRRNQIPRKEED
jgi:hypothetical protein